MNVVYGNVTGLKILTEKENREHVVQSVKDNSQLTFQQLAASDAQAISKVGKC